MKKNYDQWEDGFAKIVFVGWLFSMVYVLFNLPW